MIFCVINDIEIYLEEISVRADAKDQRVNDYQIHQILKVEKYYK